ncbi:hypothetical protein D3C76_1531830 [compost metagenome]
MLESRGPLIITICLLNQKIVEWLHISKDNDIDILVRRNAPNSTVQFDQTQIHE